MSAVWRMTPAFLCLCNTLLIVAEAKGAVWRKVGESITIQCKGASDQNCLSVRKGLNDTQIYFTSKASPSKCIIDKDMIKRVQTHGVFPNVQILIKNLTEDDTGPYWCLYSKIDSEYNKETVKGDGSLLLVVTENKAASTTDVPACESSPLNRAVVYAVGASLVLLIVILVFITWLLRRRSSPSVKPSRVPGNNNNDVYEDMRGTIRR
ncbi:uncharacterized protein si:rp71-81e14.2 [Kryptolebias marmoratus]|uniref:uncharacterized protein si:rp71-81e14.2 n=1 Tax=Kryptolebias marmoratus TaxID=37003 RepID=UPI0007F8EE80|nr:uncharacterized protein si:rp71-81e14.2 [Kryptolebias marmoratus]